MRFSRWILIIALLVVSLAACSSPTTPTPEPVTPALSTPLPPPTALATNPATIDPCAPENINQKVQDLHRFMRAFEDASALASNTARDQLSDSIAELQKIRREAEDFPVPYCLSRMKEIQLAHMNTTINVLLAFMGGQDQPATEQGILAARNLHDLYLLEMAHVLGITLVAQPSVVTPNPETSTSASPASTSTLSGSAGASLVTNVGPATVNLRRLPSFVESETIGILLVGQQATALARNADQTWYLIEIPGQPGKVAWVLAKLVTLAAAPETLPVVTPQP